VKVIVDELEERLDKDVLVFVNQTRVLFPIEFDMEEGWVKAREYNLPKELEITGEEVLQGKDPEIAAPMKCREIILKGKVEVAYWAK